jgi:hypothetical protein
MEIAAVATTHKLWITMNADAEHDGFHHIYVEAEVRGLNQGSAVPLAISPKHHGYGYSTWEPKKVGDTAYKGMSSIAAYTHWGPVAVRSHCFFSFFFSALIFFRLLLASKASEGMGPHV